MLSCCSMGTFSIKVILESLDLMIKKDLLSDLVDVRSRDMRIPAIVTADSGRS